MKPLLYLTVRSFVNGVKRAVFHPLRLLSLLFLFSYFGFMVVRPFQRTPSFELKGMAGREPSFVMPPASTFEPVVFGIFALLSMFLSVNALSQRAHFKPADVDVLFPTPVNPKLVMLFRIARDYFFTLITPFFILLLSGRDSMGSIQRFMRNMPEYGASFARVGMGTWFLLAFMWVLISYAASLFVNRSDRSSDRNKWILLSVILAPQLIAIGIVAYALRQSFTLESARMALENPITRVAMWPATFASSIVMAPLTGNFALAAVGLTGLVVASTAAVRIALSQVSWMYDQAAARGVEGADMKKLQMQGDAMGMLAEYARKGKIKNNRFAKAASRWIARGPMALAWREVILQFRGGIWQQLLLALIATVMVGSATYAAGSLRNPRAVESFFVFMTFVSTFMLVTGVSQVGFVETLKRVDVLKPLPFSPARTMFAEVFAKSVPSIVIILLVSLIGLFAGGRLWDESLTCALIAPIYGLALSALMMLVTLLFPDIDDATQRGFRSMVSMVVLAIGTLPTILLWIGVFSLKWSPFVLVPILIPINLAIAAAAAWASGHTFAAYNPSE